jgi:hypothetical protein
VNESPHCYRPIHSLFIAASHTLMNNFSNAPMLQLLSHGCASGEGCSAVNKVPFSHGCFSTDSAVGRSRHSGFSIACRRTSLTVKLPLCRRRQSAMALTGL